jgi:serine/threonine protein kinase
MGTDHWIAPEMIRTLNSKDGTYGISVDVWAFGVFCKEVAMREPPFFSLRDNHGKLYQKILNEPYTPLGPLLAKTKQQKWSATFNDFVKMCLDKDETKRLPAKELLNHPFLADAESHRDEFKAWLDDMYASEK